MKEIFKNTWQALERTEKKHFVILSVLDVFISILDILSLALLLWIIKFYVQPFSTNLPFLPRWLADKGSVSFIAIFFLLFGIKNLAGYFTTKAQYKFIGRIAVRISEINLAHYQEGDFEDFVNIDSSVQIRRTALQPFEFCQYIVAGMQQIITQSLLIILTVTAIVLFKVKLFLLLLLILLPPVVLVFYIIKKRLTRAKMHIRSSNERSYQYLLDALKGYVEANVYKRNEFFMKRFIAQREKFSTHLFDSIALQSMPSRIIEIFAVLGLFMLIAIAEWSGANDSSAFITIGAFMAAAYKIIPGIVKLINITGQIRAYEYSIAELIPRRKDSTVKETPALHLVNSISLKDICFNYGEAMVLDRLNLDVQKGDFIGITGQSGKGKTTILNLVLGFLSPASGRILVNGIPVTTQDLKTYWGSISYVRQQAFFIHDTTLRNITLEEEQYDEQELALAMEMSGMNEFVDRFPEGIKKIITENGKNISGGQQQRVALARAIYKNADLVLLDEPFNELDDASAIVLLEHFKELSRKGKMIIMITHDKKSLAYCNKTVSLDEH